MTIEKKDYRTMRNDLRALIRKKLFTCDINPLVYVEILGRKYMSCLDTGATSSLINSVLAEKLRERGYYPDKSDRLFNTANGVVRCNGVVRVPLKLTADDRTYFHKFFVINDLPLDF